MEIEGTIHKITDSQTFGSSFKKREMILKTFDDKYPQMLSIEFHNDKTEYLNNAAEGENVKVFINLRGKEWVNPEGVTKYFNSLVGWKIEEIKG